LADPFAYEEYRKKKIAQKLEEKVATRITKPRKIKKVSVNQFMAERIAEDTKRLKEQQQQQQQQQQPSEKTKPSKVPEVSILEDPRFNSLFTNPDFKIDTESEEYKRVYSKEKVRSSNQSLFDSSFSIF
jgi:ribosome biogenesis protein ENP2